MSLTRLIAAAMAAIALNAAEVPKADAQSAGIAPLAGSTRVGTAIAGAPRASGVLSTTGHRPFSCSFTPDQCKTVITKHGEVNGLKILLIAEGVKAALGCVGGILSDGELQRHPLSWLVANPITAEACFAIAEELKDHTKFNTRGEIEYFCDDAEVGKVSGLPGLRDQAGIRVRNTMLLDHFPGTKERLEAIIKKHGLRNVSVTSDNQGIQLVRVTQSRHIYTKAEAAAIIVNHINPEIIASEIETDLTFDPHRGPILTFDVSQGAVAEGRFIMHGDHQTRAKAMKSPMEGLFNLHTRILGSVRTAIEKLGASEGLACLGKSPDGAYRLSARATAAFTGDTCTGRAKVNGVVVDFAGYTAALPRLGG